MRRSLNAIAILLGVAGLIPFLACAYAATAWTGVPASNALLALLAYGAVTLSFLGGVHWGFALGEPSTLLPPPAASGLRIDQMRLLLGVVPSLVGWVALLVQIVFASAESGLAVLIAGFVGAVAVEAQARQRALVPARYMWLRWLLSIIVVAVLTTVLVLRLLGARIIL